MVNQPDTVQQGDVRWADLADPPGSAAGFRRPVVVVQGNALNRSRIATVVCVPLTSNLKWARAPGNVLVKSAASGLDRNSVAQVALILAIDRDCLSERVGTVPDNLLKRIMTGVDLVLGRS